ATGQGHARLATVVGEAGMGKSRLAEEFISSVERQARVVRGRCLPYGRGITFWPLVEIIREAASIGEDDPPELGLAKLNSLAGDSAVAERVASVVGLWESQFSGEAAPWATRRLLGR